jgi:membrane-bound lytic murein transglycosylase B
MLNMPSAALRLACLAAVVAACALPASASATATGGVSAPSGQGTVPDASVPTGGARPTAPTSPKPKPKATTKKKKKKKKKHHTPVSHPVPDNPVPDGGGDIPSDFLRFYHASGEANGVSWRILAAIGKNESDHGRSTLPGVASGVNFAHCCAGPMQMCTRASCGNTWSYYAADGDGDGTMSVYDPADAIAAAGAMLKDLKAMFGNHPGLIMAAYNAGPGNVQRYHGVPPFSETKAYVAKGLAYMGTLAP